MPALEGEHRVIVKWAEKEIHKSPWKVMVEAAAGDASKVTASGPGLEKTGVIVSKKTYFEVFTKGNLCIRYCVEINSNKINQNVLSSHFLFLFVFFFSLHTAS